MIVRSLPAPPSSTRILVIDDDEMVLQSLSDLLERAGYLVHALASPIGATRVIATQGISLAVIDLNMPIMSGDRFISLVRSWDRICELPVVLISGDSIEKIRAAAAQLRGVSIVTKSQMYERLVPVIAGLLSSPGNAGAEASSAEPSESSSAAPITRSLVLTARSALAIWREFVASRVPSPRLGPQLATCRAEAKVLGLPNTAQILAIATELVDNLPTHPGVASELDSTFSELLTVLASGDLARCHTFDRSLSLTIHRSRLERARQA